jgi:hypothetical protein
MGVTARARWPEAGWQQQALRHKHLLHTCLKGKLIMKALQTLAAAALTLATTLAVAAPEIGGSVTIKGNKAKNIVVTGGSGSVGIGPFKGGSLDMAASANINSVVVKNGKIGGSVNIIDNKAQDLTITGAAANVNSVVLGY